MALPLLDLVPVAAVIVAIALTLLVVAMVKGLFNPLASLPVVGGAIRGLEDTIVHALMSFIGLAIRGTEKLVGASFHAFARMLDWAWREITAHANLIAALAGPVGLLWGAYAGLRSLVHHLTATGTHSDARLKEAYRELGRLEHREKALERDLARGIGEDVLPRIKALDKEISRLRHDTIPAIRAADAQAESAISNLYEWAKGNASLLGVGTFAFAVTAVLDAIGLGGIRCPSFGNLFNKRGCGLWGLLDDLLGVVVAALALENVCTFLPLLEAAFGDVVGPIIHLLTEVPLGDCEKPPKAWAQLSVAAGPLPPPQTLGALPV